MIKSVESVAQYKIAIWAEQNFYNGSVTVKFTGTDKAIVTDQTGDSLNVRYVQAKGIVVDE